MKGVVFSGNRQIEFLDFPDPTPGPLDVVLQIKASGFCGSDLKFYRAAPGEANKALGIPGEAVVIAGHEPCGVVVEVGSHVPEAVARVGDRMMVHHYRGCGACPHCATGWQQLCVEGVAEVYGVTGHGAHAPYMKVPAKTLVRLPEEVSFEAGAAISCGVGTAWGALHRLDLRADHTIAVFGQGPVGLAVTQLAASMSARVIALDINAERLEKARSLGADVTINPESVDAVAMIREMTGGLGAHLALDASSSPAARVQAARCVRTWGRVCYVGEGAEVTLSVSPDLIRRQVTVIGHWTFSTIGQAECAHYVAEHKIDVDSLFTDHWALSQADEAYRHFDRQASGKGVFIL